MNQDITIKLSWLVGIALTLTVIFGVGLYAINDSATSAMERYQAEIDNLIQDKKELNDKIFVLEKSLNKLQSENDSMQAMWRRNMSTKPNELIMAIPTR